jgi:hypothetical protein
VVVRGEVARVCGLELRGFGSSTEAYPHDMGPNSRVPFSNTGIGGQLWGMLKRMQPTEEPIWPVCSLGTDSANRDVHDRICLPLALAVTRGIVDPNAVTRVVKRSFEKGKVADADKEAEAALHGCLQRFHVTLAKMWSMAVAVNHDRDFQAMLTSLEILLAASLLSKIKLPPAFAEDIFLYLFSLVQLLASEEGQPLRPPDPTPWWRSTTLSRTTRPSTLRRPNKRLAGMRKVTTAELGTLTEGPAPPGCGLWE